LNRGEIESPGAARTLVFYAHYDGQPLDPNEWATPPWQPGGYNAARTSMDLPISQLVLGTAESARGPVVKLPTMGGSVPLYMIEEVLHAPTITVPIANHDNNQHSFDENIRLENLWDGIELLAALLAM